jgi:hypothetical protein
MTRWCTAGCENTRRRKSPASGLLDPDDPKQLARLAVALHVHPARRDTIARQEVTQLVAVPGEAVADDPHPARLERGSGLPGVEEILHDRIELLLGRVPRLEQVVVERHVVDGCDGRLGVGIRGQEHALGVGHQRAGLDQVVGAGHARHPLVCDQHGCLVAAGAQLAQHLERLGARARPQDPVALPEAAAQIPGDRAQHRRLVIDSQNRRTSLGWHASEDCQTNPLMPCPR